MLRSTDRILTTHVGALPRPDDLIDLNYAVSQGQAQERQKLLERLPSAVADVVRQQRQAGVDVVNDGEYGKAMRARADYGAWLSYVSERLTGWEDVPPGTAPPPAGGEKLVPRAMTERRDRRRFAPFYEELAQVTRVQAGGVALTSVLERAVTGPVRYRGQAAIQADIANLKAALAGSDAPEAFMTSVAPGSFGRHQNRFYPSQQEFLFAIAEAMREEYRAIVDAGLILQLDDPGIAENWDAMDDAVTIADYRQYAQLCIEAANHALQGLPEERVRYHLCWGSWHGPHVTDLPLESIADLLLQVRASAYSVEAGNVRHEHEWRVWQEVKLPEGKVLIPGVVSHATNVVEHPQVVADRVVRYARVVGRENVIASTDCGLGGRIHPTLAWAKLQSLAEGARLASRELWGAPVSV